MRVSETSAWADAPWLAYRLDGVGAPAVKESACVAEFRAGKDILLEVTW
jgi:hypothetical protein